MAPPFRGGPAVCGQTFRWMVLQVIRAHTLRSPGGKSAPCNLWGLRRQIPAIHIPEEQSIDR